MQVSTVFQVGSVVVCILAAISLVLWYYGFPGQPFVALLTIVMCPFWFLMGSAMKKNDNK